MRPRTRTPAVGHRFGLWTVVTPLVRVKGNNHVAVRCDCGTERVVCGTSLRLGRSRGCTACRLGSGSRTHGQTAGYKHTTEYSAWAGMRSACRNPNDPKFCRYGGHGVTIAPEWDDFAAFLRDMGPRPSRVHVLTRHDPDGPYSPANCCWGRRGPAASKSPLRRIEFEGRVLTVTEWAREKGLTRNAIEGRLAAGWSIEEVLTRPLGVYKKKRGRPRTHPEPPPPDA